MRSGVLVRSTGVARAPGRPCEIKCNGLSVSVLGYSTGRYCHFHCPSTTGGDIIAMKEWGNEVQVCYILDIHVDDLQHGRRRDWLWKSRT